MKKSLEACEKVYREINRNIKVYRDIKKIITKKCPEKTLQKKKKKCAANNKKRREKKKWQKHTVKQIFIFFLFVSNWQIYHLS